MLITDFRLPTSPPLSRRSVRDAAGAEISRLDAHFRRVLSRLHQSPPPGLGPAQRRARASHLERLDRYRRRRRFPQNRRHSARMIPIFVDDMGTRCAMGHLIEGAGGEDLVMHVAKTRNHDRVHALTDLDDLVSWLEANGITADEAALIQPSYCDVAARCFCSDNSAVNTLLEGDLIDPSTLDVTAVHGDDVGVVVGDMLVLDSVGSGELGDHVFASAFAPSGDELNVYVRWVQDPNDEILVTACPPAAFAPGPLPVDVFVDAIVADSQEACESVLGAHNASWTQQQGDCSSPSTSVTTSSSTGTGGAGGSMTPAPASTSTTVSSCATGYPSAGRRIRPHARPRGRRVRLAARASLAALNRVSQKNRARGSHVSQRAAHGRARAIPSARCR